MDGFAVRYGLAIDSYALNRSIGVSFAIRPRYDSIAVSFAIGYVADSNALDGSVDDDRVFTRGVACIGKTVEDILAGLIELGAGHISGKARTAGLLYEAFLIALEGDILRIRVGAVAHRIIVCPKLCIGSLTVNGYGVICRLVRACIYTVEGVFTFGRKLCARGIRSVGACAGLLNVGSRYANVVRGDKLDVACIGMRTRGNHGRTAIKRTRRCSCIERNANYRGLIRATVNTVEIIRTLGCKLSSA